jgi:hypothetical protein
VNAGIQVIDAFQFIHESRLTLTTPIIVAVSLESVSAITIDVHIAVRSSVAVQEDSPVYVATITHILAFVISIIKSFGKYIFAFLYMLGLLDIVDVKGAREYYLVGVVDCLQIGGDLICKSKSNGRQNQSAENVHFEKKWTN